MKLRPGLFMAFILMLSLTVGGVLLERRPAAAQPKCQLATISNVPHAMELVWSPNSERLASANPGWRRRPLPRIGSRLQNGNWTASYHYEIVPPTTLASVKVWDAATGEVATTLLVSKGVGAVEWDAAGARLTAAEPDQALRVYGFDTDLARPKSVETSVRGQVSLITDDLGNTSAGPVLRFRADGCEAEWRLLSPNHKWVVASDFREAQAGLKAWVSDDYEAAIKYGEVGPSANSSWQLFPIKLWDLETGQQRPVENLHLASSGAWSPNSQRLALVARTMRSIVKERLILDGSEQAAEVWICDPQTARPILQCEGTVMERDWESPLYQASQVVWSADGKRVMVQSGATYIVWNAETGKRLLERAFDQDPACADAETKVSWSPDGSRVAVHARDGTVHLWGPARWRISKLMLAGAAACLLVSIALIVLARVRRPLGIRPQA